MIGRGKSGSVRGVGGCAKRVRAHVSDARRLGSGPGGGHSRRTVHGTCRSTSDEPSADLAGGIEFPASKRPSASDGVTWSTV